MLVLTRKSNESIMIGEEILITILSINGNQVKIGLDAPKNVQVFREKLFERIQKSKLTGIDGGMVDSNNE